MTKPIVIIGTGEMGGVFARGFLRAGYPVYPINRAMNIAEQAQAYPEPELVLVAVGEADLHATLTSIPAAWRDKLGLLQNELLPRDWQSHSIENPTVISVWFEKKPGQDAKVLIASPAYGPKALILVDSLQSIGIDARMLNSEEELLFELVRKNVYILTTNIAGLECGGNVQGLLGAHQGLAELVGNEVMDIQDFLTAKQNNRVALMQGFEEGINGDLAHQCMGRSAPARLKRALAFADEASIAAPKLRQIYKQFCC
ncbi:MAG: NAD(P)-binding domain-containing protein [Gammaproteobacteria bacterium]|nr:NAD(P)-binding domain-containing protein [Gammaproteobacteria bacterium]